MTLFASEEQGNQIATIFGAAVCAALAMSAGIGGGGLFVPLLILSLNKTISTATSMSQCLIMGAAMAGLLYNLQQRHPKRDRPLIDVSLVLFLAPLQMAGALCGNVLNRMLPPITLVVMMVVVLSISDIKTLMKGWELWKRESAEKTIAKLSRSATHSMQSTNAGSPAQPEKILRKRQMFRRWADYVFRFKKEIEENTIDERPYLRPYFEPYFEQRESIIELMPLTESGQQQTLRQEKIFLEKESRHNMKYWIILGIVWCITLMLIFVRGAKGAESIFGVPFCGIVY